MLFRFCFCCCFFFSESFVKLLIEAKHLEKEKENALKEILTQIVQTYEKFHDQSGGNLVGALKSFTNHIIDAYGVVLVTVCKGSIIIILDCPTLEQLEHLWSDYISGQIDKLAEKYLVTDEIKKKLNLNTICLKTTIAEENYLNCKKALVELPRTCPGEFKQSVSEVRLYCT